MENLTQAEALMVVGEMINLMEHVDERLRFAQELIDDSDFPIHFNEAKSNLSAALDLLTEIVVYGSNH